MVPRTSLSAIPIRSGLEREPTRSGSMHQTTFQCNPREARIVIDVPQPNRAQADVWNAAGGHAWVQLQHVLDGMLAPFNAMLIECVRADRPCKLLDIGCGAGATTLWAAKRLPQGSSCLGVDISAPLIATAVRRQREEGQHNATFVVGDAQTYAFEPNVFDAVISRFGVMFFDDPEGAFRNVRRAARAGAHLAFVAWRSPAENPFMTIATEAAAPWLPGLATPDTNAPGQFAFADPERVRRILSGSGWQGVDVRPVAVPVRVDEEHLMDYVTRMGPVGRALIDADDVTRVNVTAALQATFSKRLEQGAVHFTAACWLVTASG